MRLVKRVFSLILLLAFLSSLGCSSGEPDSSADTTGSGEDTTEKTADTEPIDVPAFEKREDQVYAADLFDSSETLNIAFMGGSLTSGGISYNKLMPNWPISSNTWTNNIITYFVKKYKSTKTVYALNAALPGTSSDFAAERFDAQVVPFEPDILFIEYAVNDWNFDSYNATAHCEYIIRRCLDLDKIPVIIFLYAPFPMEDDDYRFERYTNGIEAKKGLVEHYGLTGVDAWDYVRELYKADETELSFTDWLSNAGKGYYNRVSDTYVDVHPFSTGYALFSDAIIKQLDEDFDAVLNRPAFADIYTEGSEEYMNARFSFVAQNDPRLTYTGDWIVNDAENPYVADPVYGGEDRIETDNYVVPHFPDGIRQAINAKGASFTLETSADSVMVMGLTSKLALKASVTVDGSDEVIGTCGPTTETTCMNQISDWVELPGDGKTHTVKFTIPDSTEDGGAGLFRFGYIIERYDGE